MREQFRAFYSPTPGELDKLWNEAVIVFDANTLLNLFRYSAATRDELIELLTKEKDRLWIPHQVGLEFQRNRRLIASQQDAAFASVEKALGAAESSIGGAIGQLQRHPTKEADELSELIRLHMKKVRKKFKQARSRHFKAVLDQAAHDRTLNSISELYEGNVGEPYSVEHLQQIYKEGADRFAKKIPPGYMDKGKEGDDKFGDLVLWRQILDHGAQIKKPIMFITDDAKEDWWFRSGGKTFGPRPELVAEYFASAGERAHFYQPRQFLKVANERGEKISQETIAEARSVSHVRTYRHDNEALTRALREFSRASETGLKGVDAHDFADRFAEASRHGDSTTESLRLAMEQFESSNVLRALAEQESRRSAMYRRALEGETKGSIAAYLAALERHEGSANDTNGDLDDSDNKPL